jgi:PAS domain S-box-containing protein
MSRNQIAAGEMSCASLGPLLAQAEGFVSHKGPKCASDLQLSHLFEISPDLLALASAEDQKWLRTNPAIRKVLGWNEDDLIGHPLLDIVFPADHDRVKAVEANVRQRGEATLEVRLICKEGGCRWIAWHIGHDQEAQSLLLIGRDVTQRRRAMKNLRVASVRMQRENENLEHFVKTAGHDLQEPLRTLSMYSDLLIRRHASDMPGQSVELLTQIFGAAGRMHALVRDLLVYASISRDEEDHCGTFTEVSLQDVFENALDSLKSSIEECSATITHDPLPEVQGDETQLTQLLQNLLSNSLKYRCPQGPVKIHIRVQEACGEWQFHIMDNGSGFDPKHAENIFLDFKRLHGREIPGTGLGLPICRRIVKRHGGRIWAEGRPGEGATFCFTLPTRSSPAE